jgi:hypothetical protein
MQSHHFCSVCKQGLWNSLMQRITLIDAVRQSCTGGSISVAVDVLQLAQFRQLRLGGLEEKYYISWSRKGVHVPEFDGLFNATLPAAGESWTVVVKFETSQVRRVEYAVLESKKTFVTCQ